MTNKPVLIDVMIDGRFYTQVSYTKRGKPQIVDGVIKEVHDTKEIEAFVYEKLPSLKSKKHVNLAFASQQVLV